ncbi:MAG: hypothetical protein GVY24_04430 [Planctomycetes bacterium]|jgi:putative transposase|nr:hypothetical protein [Planctomycetota bacterium]
MKTRRVLNIPGHAHELTFSCYRRMPLLSRDRTRRWLIDALEHARRKHEVMLIAYVIMPEHVHLIVKPSRAAYRMEEFARSVKQSVARRALNWLREHEPGFLPRLAGERAAGRVRHHFWMPGGGYDRNIDQPETLPNMLDYLHANPVRRGLVDRPCDWIWSSARFYAGEENVLIDMDRLH